jgi:hypothetical protein
VTIATVDEPGYIVPSGEAYLDRVVSTRDTIELFEPLAESVCGYAYDGVALWVKIGRTTEGFDCDAVLFDPIARPGEVFLANKNKKPRQIAGPTEQVGCQNGLELGPLCIYAVNSRQWSAHCPSKPPPAA